MPVFPYHERQATLRASVSVPGYREPAACRRGPHASGVDRKMAEKSLSSFSQNKGG